MKAISILALLSVLFISCGGQTQEEGTEEVKGDSTFVNDTTHLDSSQDARY